MIFIFDGHEASHGAFKLFKAADHSTINIRLVNDDGSPVNMTGATATLEVYDRTDRKNTATASLALTVASATAGHLTLTPTVAGMNFGPGTYYAYVKHVVTAGSVVTITTNNLKIVIG